ncbi:MAG: cation transporter [Chloroflexia bacterium]|nr:cation transporter [Chloroflexia bacterium]
MTSQLAGPKTESGGAGVSFDRAQRTAGIRRVLLGVLVLNVVVAVAKLGYGLWSGSMAMTADGVQSMLDGLANVVGLAGIAVAARPPDQEHLYGHERYETLASLVIAAMMTVGVIQIVESAVGRIRSGHAPDVSAGSFVVLLGTMAINFGVSLWERRRGKALRSEILLADAKHTLSDVLVSTGVIIGLIGVALGFEAADAIVSIGIAVIIAVAAWTIIREASLVLTDAIKVDPRELMAAIRAAPGVITAHNLRARSSGGRLWVEVHVTVDPDLRVQQAHDVATGVEATVRSVAGEGATAMVHVEPAVPPHTRPDPLLGDVPPAPLFTEERHVDRGSAPRG